MAHDDRFLTPREAAEFLGFSTSTISKLRCRGDGPAYHRVHRRIRYRHADLVAWLHDARRRSTSEPQRGEAEIPREATDG